MGVSGHVGVWLSSWSHLPCGQPPLLILLGLLPAAFVLFCPGKLQNWLSSWPFSSRPPNLLFPFFISSNGHSEVASSLFPAQVFTFSHSFFRVRYPEIASSPRKLHDSSHSSSVPNVPGQYLHAWLRFPAVLVHVCTQRSQIRLQAHRTLHLRIAKSYWRVLYPYTEKAGSFVELMLLGSLNRGWIGPRVENPTLSSSFGTTEEYTTLALEGP